MKKFLTLLIAGLLFSSIALAASASTVVEDRDDPIGVGADITVVQFDNDFVESVNIEVKRDVDNSETSAYLMIHLNLDNLLKGLGETVE